ncbi:MAG: hypothetical protein K2J12_08065 [Muribaculaceae bacterium]|nr:hypothetical protein [Muribaculaceae bacterium]
MKKQIGIIDVELPSHSSENSEFSEFSFLSKPSPRLCASFSSKKSLTANNS